MPQIRADQMVIGRTYYLQPYRFSWWGTRKEISLFVKKDFVVDAERTAASDIPIIRRSGEEVEIHRSNLKSIVAQLMDISHLLTTEGCFRVIFD